MKFVEMTGRTLADLMTPEEMHSQDLKTAGIDDQTIVRVNEHGDIEVRRPQGWDVIGGLLGDYAVRIRNRTGMEWV